MKDCPRSTQNGEISDVSFSGNKIDCQSGWNGESVPNALYGVRFAFGLAKYRVSSATANSCQCNDPLFVSGKSLGKLFS